MRQLALWVYQKKTENLSDRTFVTQGDRFGDRFAAVYHAIYPLELLFVIFAKLLVLQRVQHLTLFEPRWQHVARLTSRIFLVVVVAGNLIGVVVNFVAAVFYSEAADARVSAGLAWASNQTDAQGLENNSNAILATATTIASAQRFIEAIVLVLVLSAFVVVGIL